MIDIINVIINNEEENLYVIRDGFIIRKKE